LPEYTAKLIVEAISRLRKITMYHHIPVTEQNYADNREDTAEQFDMDELYKWLERPLSEDEQIA
jgi:hypothetical protein